MRIRRSILAGDLPGQRTQHFEDQPFDLMWLLLTDCWQSLPENRPSILRLLEQACPMLQVSEHQFEPQLPTLSRLVRIIPPPDLSLSC